MNAALPYPTARTARLFLPAALWLAALAPCLLPERADALEPEQREATVISARVWDGYDYKEIFLPSSSNEMTLIAGQDSAIAFVRTLEYYWPLSRQVYVNFERQRDLVEGELIVRRDGEIVAREASQPYALLFDEGAVKGGGRILWGDEAKRAHIEYQENERRFARDFSEAQRIHADYQRRLVQAGAARLRGEPAEEVEPPPPLPEPSLRLVTAPSSAFRVRLEPGVYTMELENRSGRVQGTRRTLRVIDLSGRASLVADIVPEERWTKPLASNSEAARLFARPGTTFYLTLAEASRFREAEYLPVVNPQAEPVEGRTMWVRRRPAEIDRLQLGWNGVGADTLSRQPLKVEQTRSSGFGYRVRTARGDEEPDLNAFTLQVPADPIVRRGLISLDQQADAPFTREVVVVHRRRASLGLVLALLPLAVYVAALCLRHLNRRKQPADAA